MAQRSFPRSRRDRLLTQLPKPIIWIFRDYLGIADPHQALYTFASHGFRYIMLTHILFLISFAVFYCVVAEKFPKITLFQGLAFGVIVSIAAYRITLPILGLTPPFWGLQSLEFLLFKQSSLRFFYFPKFYLNFAELGKDFGVSF